MPGLERAFRGHEEALRVAARSKLAQERRCGAPRLGDVAVRIGARLQNGHRGSTCKSAHQALTPRECCAGNLHASASSSSRAVHPGLRPSARARQRDDEPGSEPHGPRQPRLSEGLDWVHSRAWALAPIPIPKERSILRNELLLAV